MRINQELKNFTQRVLITVTIVGVLLMVGLIVRDSTWIFLLIFAGLLLAVFLDGVASWLSKRLPFSRGWGLALVSILIPAILTGIGFMAGPSIAEQMDQLSQRIPQAFSGIKQALGQYSWGQTLLSQIPPPKQILSRFNLSSQLTSLFSTTFGALTNTLIAIILGLYLAVQPALYINGLVQLFPKKKHPHAREVLHSVGRALRWWLTGRLASMTVVGILTGLGLFILGVPLALILGFIAALLSFIPNVGPLLSVIPAVLVGLSDGPMTALYIVLLYTGVQTVESYLITPIIQEQAVSLPPALLLSIQILMGYLVGILGLLMATPLLVVIMVLVQKLYVQDILNESVPELGK